MYPEILIVILPSVDRTHLEIHGNTQERIIFLHQERFFSEEFLRSTIRFHYQYTYLFCYY